MAHELSIELVRTGAPVRPCDEHSYDDELDDVRSAIQDACTKIAASGAARFIVSGFAAVPWPVDVETDLAVILEQLPDAMTALRQSREFALDFYEQGLERTLCFRPNGSSVDIECVSRHASWTPEHPLVRVEGGKLEEMLRAVAVAFIQLLQDACPRLAGHEWLDEWRSQVGVE